VDVYVIEHSFGEMLTIHNTECVDNEGVNNE
jgi:hypothetical protein